MITKKGFSCVHCGKCCQMLTKVNPSDIKKIVEAGYTDFTMKNPLLATDQNIYLKRNGIDCIFLGWRDGMSFCKIYARRPEVCENYPFFGKKKLDAADCTPQQVLKKATAFTILQS